MKRSLLFIALPVAAALLFTAYRLFESGEAAEDARYAGGLTELVVSNLSGESLVLVRAGSRLSDTVSVAEVTEGSLWLGPGNYFIRCDQQGRSTYFPVPLTGYRCGPDRDGSYQVTVRSLPLVTPPIVVAGLTEYAFIPGGTLLLGDRQLPHERHYVWLTGFFVGRFETTNREFRAFLDATDGYRDTANWTEEGRRWTEETASAASALLVPGDAEYQRFGQPDRPVTMVSWFEANSYCRWLSRRYAGGKWLFSLPTDAEWEKAARGPDNFDYGLSMAISDAEEGLYNWKKNPGAEVTVLGVDSTLRGGVPNRFGLYHLTGNVAEWSQSVERPYSRENPFAEDDRNHDDVAGQRSVRGGSWYSAAISILQNPYRDAFPPEHRTRDVGFRVVARILP